MTKTAVEFVLWMYSCATCGVDRLSLNVGNKLPFCLAKKLTEERTFRKRVVYCKICLLDSLHKSVGQTAGTDKAITPAPLRPLNRKLFACCLSARSALLSGA